MGPDGSSLLGERLRLIRVELFGEDSVDTLTGVLGLAPAAWQRYERHPENMPATVLLRFIAITGANPGWLLQGGGGRYRDMGHLGKTTVFSFRR